MSTNHSKSSVPHSPLNTLTILLKTTVEDLRINVISPASDICLIIRSGACRYD